MPKQKTPKPPTIKLCEYCGKSFIATKEYKCRKNRNRFCSKNCFYKSRRINGKEINCEICEKKIWLHQNQIDAGITVCSHECSQLKRAFKIKVAQLDEYWATVIKYRAGWKCEYCESKKKLNAHHIYSRGVWPVRWDLDNGICLCVKHHLLGALSAHKSPLLFADWIKEQRGEVWNKRLLEKVKSGEKPDKAWEYFHLINEIESFEQLDNSENYDINDWDWDVAPRTSIIECPIDNNTSEIAIHSV